MGIPASRPPDASGAPEVGADGADNPVSLEWGTPVDTFDEDTRAEYLAQLQDPDQVHVICEEYRAAASIDREHDRADRTAGRRIACPVLVLWSGAGPLASWYIDDGGPLELWRELAPNVTGHPVDGGHFFPEEHPQDTAEALAAFVSPEGD
jgi:haloacetate dehalogenase